MIDKDARQESGGGRQIGPELIGIKRDLSNERRTALEDGEERRLDVLGSDDIELVEEDDKVGSTRVEPSIDELLGSSLDTGLSLSHANADDLACRVNVETETRGSCLGSALALQRLGLRFEERGEAADVDASTIDGIDISQTLQQQGRGLFVEFEVVESGSAHIGARTKRRVSMRACLISSECSSSSSSSAWSLVRAMTA